MAEENRRTDSEPIEIEIPTAETGTSNPDTKETGKRRGRPRKNPGTEPGTETAGTEKEKLLGLASVNSVGSDEEPPKPKKAKRKRTNKNNPTFNAEQIKALLLSTSLILGQSEGGKFFVITEKEAEQIANPLANIIAKNDSLASLGEHSDSIALMTACFMIFIPRLIGYMGYRKSKKVLKDKNVMVLKGAEKKNEQARKDSPGDRKPDGDVAGINENANKGILSGLPSIAY